MKKILISLLSIIFIISMITTVYAATGSVNLSASADSVFKGKTFTVTVTASGDNNVTGFSSKLSYDKSKLSLESKVASNGFTDVPSGDELNAGILSTEGITLSKSVVIYTLTFKVLDNAEVGDTEISLTDIGLGLVNEDSVQEDASASDATVKISIKADDTTFEQEEVDDDDDIDAGAGDKADSGKEDKKTNTGKGNKLPQTGVENTIVIAILSLGIVSIVSYISYKKYNNI